ncbi:hypothetical protein [Streptomyces scabiei]|uniref:hypothetical protein n=1 Tax=Streptomyces scabiei TaxID=1930 RepID=UPI0015C50E60|nr:hypothetical protein [Streptomyces scabiei]
MTFSADRRFTVLLLSFSFADAPRSGPGDVGLIDFGLINFGLIAFGLINFGLIAFGLISFGAFGSGRLISVRPSAR